MYSFSSQYVVVPTRRATAEALQIMVCHLLGDAGSPYLLGAVRLSFMVESKLLGLQYGVYVAD